MGRGSINVQRIVLVGLVLCASSGFAAYIIKKLAIKIATGGIACIAGGCAALDWGARASGIFGIVLGSLQVLGAGGIQLEYIEIEQRKRWTSPAISASGLGSYMVNRGYSADVASSLASYLLRETNSTVLPSGVLVSRGTQGGHMLRVKGSEAAAEDIYPALPGVADGAAASTSRLMKRQEPYDLIGYIDENYDNGWGFNGQESDIANAVAAGSAGLDGQSNCLKIEDENSGSLCYMQIEAIPDGSSVDYSGTTCGSAGYPADA